MVVFANRRLGPSAELFVSDDIARVILRTTAAAARPFAEARWELELVLWLDARAEIRRQVLDVSDIAWTPEHFEQQRQFLLGAVERAMSGGDHALAYRRWHRLISDHPRDAVQVGRLWQWSAGAVI